MTQPDDGGHETSATVTNGANSGGTEAINGLIEFHRRITRGFQNRNTYRPTMLPIGGGLPL